MREQIDIEDLLVLTYSRHQLHKVYSRAGLTGSARLGMGGGSSGAVARLAMLGTVVQYSGSAGMYVPDPDEDFVRVHETVMALPPKVREDVIYHAATRTRPVLPDGLPPRWGPAQGWKKGGDRRRMARTEDVPTGMIGGNGAFNPANVGRNHVAPQYDDGVEGQPIRWCRVVLEPSPVSSFEVMEAALRWSDGLRLLTENLDFLDGYEVSGPAGVCLDVPDWMAGFTWVIDRLPPVG